MIVDEYNNNYNIIYGRIYKINLHDSLPKLILTNEYKSPDTLQSFYHGRIPNWDKIQNSQPNDTIGEINPKLVDKLIETLNQPKSLGSLLDYYSIDSSWHLANKDRLIHNWLNTDDNSEKLEKEYAKYILNDFEQFKKMAYHHVMQRNTSDYDGVVIAFENKYDTLMISTSGQESFLIPWIADSTYKNYDPELSSIVSEFLPEDVIINKDTLNPSLEKFETGVLEELSFKVNFFDRRAFKKYVRKNR
ncbi:hypothetical protein GCM10023207_07250 [Marivirga lumbricoides]